MTHTLAELKYCSEPSCCVLYLPRRCGLTLPADYYTIPPLDELDSMSTDDSCLVQNFTIGRKGYGEIHFPGRTDVFGMNLAEIGKS